jgi:S23 ribosomal protein.
VESFPEIERYGLSSQIRRAIISVPSNIVEGNIKKSNKEKLHFIEIAYGSLMEVYCQIILAHDLEYINEEQLNDIKFGIDKVSMLLSRFKYSIELKQ